MVCKKEQLDVRFVEQLEQCFLVRPVGIECVPSAGDSALGAVLRYVSAMICANSA